MAKTPTSAPNRRERGAALLEAAVALALMALVAAAGFTAFGRAGAAGAAAEARLEALALAESALERGSAPGFLAAALEGEAALSGEGWRLSALPFPTEEEGPLALVRLVAEAGFPEGEDGAPLVRLETLRSLPR
ncbi:MAG: hypothetical protein ACE37J_02075 [Pikeienuella sp.]|uniref:hypothetical protein n=1 Tax=Pikeienuella sp. TaxID=2831957 RepID=UPI003919C674